MNLPRPRKKWGQNFLTDMNIARKIVATAGVGADNLVIEIGPGRGVLSDLLAANAGHYVGIEIDPLLAGYLQEMFADHGNISIVNEDFMTLDLPALLAAYPHLQPVIVGNIPYNITSPILFRLFDHGQRLSAAVLTMQREVAERLRARPGGREYGLLAINSQLFAEVTYCFNVKAKLFHPRPKVDSAVVHLRFKPDVKSQFADFELFRTILRHCFQHRRKMLRKSLSMLFSPAFLVKLGADLTRRPEQLSIPEWIDLGNLVHRHSQEEEH